MNERTKFRAGWVCLLLVTCLGCTRQNSEGRSAQSATSNAGDDTAPALAAASAEHPLRPAAPAERVDNGPGAPPGGAPQLGGLQLPPGFSIELYSADVPNARSLALGAPGTVFVSTRKSDRVYALVDADGDHHVDRVHVVASGLDTPNGIAYRGGSLYIAEIGRLLRLDEIDTRLDNPPEPVVLTATLPWTTAH
jgi:glucose/arabinose dehydrogenase